ncbi:MAG TPA: acyl-homoserine-lactone synthase [Microvirga sp.]|jgi:acyl-homoserine lactone synthase|nr:acyl-homoserine-lactone synthase [Microvirga sp.]
MYEVHAIRSDNRHLYEEALDQHFRIRNDIFIRERRWRALTSYDGREIDQFDHEDTIYLLGIDSDLGVVAGSRLLPTTRPTLLSGVFPQLAEIRGIPEGTDVYEWTRLFVVRAKRQDGRLCRWAGAVKCGMLEYCLQEGIHTFSGVAETYWMPRIIAMGWRPRALGLTLDHDGLSLCSFSVEVSEEVLASTRAFYGIEGPSLVIRGIELPQGEEAPHVRH